MLTLKVINDCPEEVIRRLAKKHFDAKDIVSQIIELDALRRNTQKKLDNTLAEINSLSKSIGSLMKDGKKEEAQLAREKVTELK
jgi:seryl-tRNA synthetase